MMQMKTLAVLACFMASGTTQASSATPKDVQAFIRNANACEHFAGEFDGSLSEKRQREIERSVVKHCQAAQKQLEQLSAKYKNDPRVSEIIRAQTNDSVTSFR
ncbi:hypothetical protein [Pseudoduganella aquatica]|uniref:DUF1090 family protein n=1 Tax=Pseudoduganella aquatica TaxID=2660641 RepID=A0A7X4HDB5_9BURK|nr:hypothetical protein [Pseudoduganella aquatica]MYN09090.1 hypothetical protein [Pseudoduganella aquatica]